MARPGLRYRQDKNTTDVTSAQGIQYNMMLLILIAVPIVIAAFVLVHKPGKYTGFIVGYCVLLITALGTNIGMDLTHGEDLLVIAFPIVTGVVITGLIAQISATVLNKLRKGKPTGNFNPRLLAAGYSDGLSLSSKRAREARNYRQCKRCGLSYLKTEPDCTHCTGLNDVQIARRTRQNDKELDKLGRLMFKLLAVVIVLTFVAVNQLKA